ncbi:MAG: hypothetical protein V2A73_00430 [Pseudomonadota bacterium]
MSIDDPIDMSRHLALGIQRAMEMAAHRWEEWGDRAVSVAEILETTTVVLVNSERKTERG